MRDGHPIDSKIAVSNGNFPAFECLSNRNVKHEEEMSEEKTDHKYLLALCNVFSTSFILI